jgi:hypothetical protein
MQWTVPKPATLPIKPIPGSTPEGVRDDLLKFVLTNAVPALHQGRTAIKKARAEVFE